MKGKVFIAWSGTNILASQVKDQLKQQDYEAIVGGDGRADTSFYVGATVLGQIDTCNQAIFVVETKADGSISNNLIFELGYALARMKANKIHIFYVNIPKGDSRIPSDLEGTWAEHILSTNCANLPEIIVSKFMENQRNIVSENKIDIIDSYHRYKDMIQQYPKSPFCSEYELAQYVLFFSQSAYLFGEENEGIVFLNAFLNQQRNHIGIELDQALRFGIAYLKVFTMWQKRNDILFMPTDCYRDIWEVLRAILKTVTKWENNDFTDWFKVLLNNSINYLMILHSYCPSITPADQMRLLKESVAYAENCLALCSKLSATPANKQCAMLYSAYMYRNLSIYQLRAAKNPEQVLFYLQKSFEERENLRMHYKYLDINTRLKDNFDMEYYLAMAELLKTETEPRALEDNLQECQSYVERVRDGNRERAHFIHKIEKHVKAFSHLLNEDEENS